MAVDDIPPLFKGLAQGKDRTGEETKTLGIINVVTLGSAIEKAAVEELVVLDEKDGDSVIQTPLMDIRLDLSIPYLDGNIFDHHR